MNKVLFIINGLGLGNSTRCHAVISELMKRDCQISIATSGNGLEYFRSELPAIPVITLNEMKYGKIGNRVSLFLTLVSMPKKVIGLIENQIKIIKFIRREKIEAVVIDSDYCLFPFGKFLRCKIISINNANFVLSKFWEKRRVPISVLPQLVIEFFDYLYQQIMAEVILSPVVFPVQRSKKTFSVSPLVRGTENNRKSDLISSTENITNVVIMLTGSSFFENLDFLNNLPDGPNLKYFVLGRDVTLPSRFFVLGRHFQNQAFLENADLLIINSGFSAVSEAIFYQKPTIAMPVGAHAEQMVNANSIVELGLGITANEGNLPEKVSYMLENLDSFPSNRESLPMAIDGAVMAATKIKEILT